MLPHKHRNVLFVSDNEKIRDIGKFIEDDSIIQTLSGKSYGHKSEKASISAHFYSLNRSSSQNLLFLEISMILRSEILVIAPLSLCFFYQNP